MLLDSAKDTVSSAHIDNKVSHDCSNLSKERLKNSKTKKVNLKIKSATKY